MIAVDTNVLLRWIVGDDAAQHALCERLLKRATAAGEAVFIPLPVVCELVWTLRSRYAADRVTIAGMLENLLDTKPIAFDQPAVARRALAAYRLGRGDFSDYLIGELAQAAGARKTYTFDETLWRDAGFAKP